jgi:hypothetical protein
MRIHVTLLALSICVLLAACGASDPPPGPDMTRLRAEMQEHTETLLLIHFKLDNALKEISAAEARAEEGGCASASYHAADAHRELQLADDQLLDLGRDLQELLNLDAGAANRN